MRSGSCILISSIAGAIGSLFLQRLIDDNILPMLENSSTDYGPLMNSLIIIISLYVVVQLK